MIDSAANLGGTYIIVAFALVAFSTGVEKKNVNVKTSTIKWTGEKLTGSHEGTISLKEGFVTMENGKLTGGEFVADMTSINVTDLEAGKGKEKLAKRRAPTDLSWRDQLRAESLSCRAGVRRLGGNV